MSRSRNIDAGREPGAFAAIPHDVLRSAKFAALSPAAVKLLCDLLAQCDGKNNGVLFATWDRMRKRGWRGKHRLVNARQELASAGFILETRKGARPNRAAWWAITWFSLKWNREMDIAASSYVRGLWRIRGGLATPKKGREEATHRVEDLTTGAEMAPRDAPNSSRTSAKSAPEGKSSGAETAPMRRTASAETAPRDARRSLHTSGRRRLEHSDASKTARRATA